MGAAAVGVGLLTSAAVSAAGQVNQANANADVAHYNAAVANQNANIALEQGQEESRRSLVNTRKIIGSGQAAYAASGVTNSGSTQWVLRNSASQGELNSLIILNNAELKANAYRNEAGLDYIRGNNDLAAGGWGAASQILRGGVGAGAAFSRVGTGSRTTSAMEALE